ncbi:MULTISPECIES: PAS domain-containing hybrid sensor histidine kinase/response regulator [unclassified Methylobacterium]|uniref:PAS domain-containing hybrid sensor histidine kinase/response regulator n=1 Tax=unclassified Methylobacterium TaxID=2615210 RepID=UPI00226A59CC|nr:MULTISPECIES: PAS domain-containing hybrid sensor histidine kinase/response regulator [unclassified Methylobacterium]
MVPESEDERDKALAECRALLRATQGKLEEAEETVAAIRRGDFDAVVVEDPEGRRYIYTLEDADRPYRVLIERIQEGAFTLGTDGTVLYCNLRLADMLGVPQERLIGISLQSFMIAAEVPGFMRLLDGATRGVVRGELTMNTTEASGLPVNLSLSPLHRDGETPLLCGVLTDLSEQRLYLRDLADASDRLRTEGVERQRIEEALRQAQKMEAVGQLTGGIAHDFNNLLTIIKSSTDLLRRPDLAEDRRHRYVDAIADTVDRAAKLTGQLLAFARRQSLKPEVFDVNRRVARIIDMLGTIVGGRIRIEHAGLDEPCCAEADISQFETALVNLAVNARDAMDGEGTLGLRVHCGSSMPGIRAHAADAGAFVAVSISDTGCGIPSDRIGHIFEPFFTTKEVGKGTGLGLSQVFGFAKQSGGNVDVVSEVGCGTTFTLYLPHVASEASEGRDGDRGPVSMASDAGGGRRVLVVEDNADVGAFSTQLLRDLGYQTTWAMNAEEALAALEADPNGFDVVFSDVIMPGMNGVELGRIIRTRRPSLPVILTSGYSHVLAEDGRHGFELLRKPYAVEDLSSVLRKVLGEQSGEAAQSPQVGDIVA